MKFSKLLMMLSLILIVTIGCKKENMDVEEITPPVIEPVDVLTGTPPPPAMLNNIHYLSSCIDFFYPVQVILDGGDVESADDYSTLHDIIYFNSVVSYVYPLEIEDGFGVKQINNAEELQAEDCKGAAVMYYYIAGCNCLIDLEYPVEIIDQDDEVNVANNSSELYKVKSNWFSSQNVEDGFLEFIYPVTFIDPIDNTETVAESYNGFIEIINNFCD